MTFSSSFLLGVGGGGWGCGGRSRCVEQTWICLLLEEFISGRPLVAASRGPRPSCQDDANCHAQSIIWSTNVLYTYCMWHAVMIYKEKKASFVQKEPRRKNFCTTQFATPHHLRHAQYSLVLVYSMVLFRWADEVGTVQRVLFFFGTTLLPYPTFGCHLQ